MLRPAVVVVAENSSQGSKQPMNWATHVCALGGATILSG
jgi:hypothetical protein